MCNLRCKPDTQKETQIIANMIDKECKELFPSSWMMSDMEVRNDK